MPHVKRPLRRAAMVEPGDDAISERPWSSPGPFAPGARESRGAATPANRADALTKLRSLLELGVLTQEQHDSEYARLTDVDADGAAPPAQLGPVQLLVIPFMEGSFDVSVLEELRRLREHDAIGMLDLLFVAKDEIGNIARVEQGDLSVQEAAAFGGLAAALFESGAGDAGAEPVGGEAGDAFADQTGVLGDAPDTWFLADAIPTGGAAAIALVEHRWAVPLRAALEAGGGRGLVDRWVHPEDLIAIGAQPA
jgi:hypothetical protein